MSTPSTSALARVGDVIRGTYGDERYTLTGHYRFNPADARPVGWSAHYVPDDPTIGTFAAPAPYDFTERDIVKPGALIAFADPWSTWCAS